MILTLATTSGQTLDTVTVGESGELSFDTGDAIPIVRQIQNVTKTQGPELAALLGGWSNGYLTLSEAVTTAAGFVEGQHPRDREGQFAEKRGSGSARGGSAPMSGEAALNSAPVRLKPSAKGHTGDYSDDELTGIADEDVKRALSEMEGVEYQVTNSYLRGGFTGDVPADVTGRVDAIDKAMAVSPLPGDVVVHRGIKDGARTFGDTWYGEFAEGTFEEQDAKWPRWQAGERPDLTGMVWEDLAYSHTTVKPDILDYHARKIADLDPVAMKILVPKGTRAVQMSGMDLEGELMLERGLRFRVVKDHGADENGVRQWDVEVIS
jgi:hypothetical protein